MKKLLFSILFLGLMAGKVWGATYYVNQSSGDNSADGSSGSPWKDIYHADSVVSSSDVVDITAPATSPYRGNINNSVASVTYQGPSGTSKAYLLGSIDLSHGAAIGERVKNSDLNSWADANILNIYEETETGDATVSREATIIRSGYSVKYVRASTGSGFIRYDLYLEGATEYTFTFYHYDTVANNRLKMNFREDLGTDNYLQANGSWSTSAYTFDDIGANVGSWAQYSITFTSNAAGRYFFTIFHGYNGASYLDDISIIPTTNTYSWTQYSGDTYQLTVGQEVKVLTKCTNSAWSSQGVLALTRPVMGSDKDTLNSGEWVWASGVLYYKLSSGETIGNIHFEGSQPLEYPTVVEDVVKVTADTVSIDQLWAGVGGSNNFNITGAISGVTGADCDSFAGGKDNVGNGWSINTGASATLTDCTGKYDGTKALYTSSATVVLWRFLAEYGWSGGVYSWNGSTVTAYLSRSLNNGREAAADNSGFTAHSGAANNLTLVNCTSLNNYGRGVSVAGSGTVSVKNTIGYGTTLGSSTDAHIDSGFSGSFTHENNMFGGYYTGWTPDATELTGDPIITDQGKISRLSDCVHAGQDASALYGIVDPWGKYSYKKYNIGADQGAGAPNGAGKPIEMGGGFAGPW